MLKRLILTLLEHENATSHNRKILQTIAASVNELSHQLVTSPNASRSVSMLPRLATFSSNLSESSHIPSGSISLSQGPNYQLPSAAAVLFNRSSFKSTILNRPISTLTSLHSPQKDEEEKPKGPRVVCTMSTQPLPKPKHASQAKQNRELKAVNTAVTVNVAIMASKLLTWGFTSSGAMLAEALHSLADIVNQLLLRAGVQQSRRPPTVQHPYGYGREKYVYALMSAVGVFCLGAGASVVHGIQCLLEPPDLEHMAYNMWVLGASSVAELFSLRVALQTIRANARESGQHWWKFMTRGNDPTTASVLAEDAGAVAGLAIAGATSYMTLVTGNPIYDACGSITIGMLMGGIAVALIRNNKRFLIGQSISPEVEAGIVSHLKSDGMVLNIIDPKSEAMADGVYRFKAEIQWNGDRIMHKYLNSLDRDSLYTQIRSSVCSADIDPVTLSNAMDMAMMEVGRGVIRTIGEEIDRLEAELVSLVPGLVYVDLETDRGRMDNVSSIECPVTPSPEDIGNR